MGEVEDLWGQGRLIPMELAPVALWHLFENPQPTEPKVILNSEEHLGAEF